MKRNSWIILFSIILAYLYFIKFPIIRNDCHYNGNSSFSVLKKGNKFKLSDKIKMSEDKKYKMILIIADRYDVPTDFPFGTVFTTTDKGLVKNFLNTNFMMTGSDVATVESEIFLYENDQCIFRSGILLSTEGLQNSDFGWVKPENNNELNLLCRKFNSNYYPIITLK